MTIQELRILPPLAVGRLGASAIPLEAYTLQLSNENPLDFRKIVPEETLTIDPTTGAVTSEVPSKIVFKDGVDKITDKDGKIRPVAPFLEVFAITSDDPLSLVPLTLDLLAQAGLSIDDISWDVEVGNIKIFRRTEEPDDKIYAKQTGIKDHVKHALEGECTNFRTGRTLPLGHVQFIAPCTNFPGIRFRFTPAAGKVYGTSLKRHTSRDQEEDDPIINDDSLLLYDDWKRKAKWRGYYEKNPATATNPGQIYAGYEDEEKGQVSWGYLDDECDGFVAVNLTIGEDTLTARANIGAGPPAFAPDTLPVRVVVDELEQIILGPELDADEVVTIGKVEELVRRAFETVRLMNSNVMNGNAVNGQRDIASTMVRQDAYDFGRFFEPIMATSLVDNLALRVLHERVFSGLGTGAAAWFADALRRSDEIGDLSNEGRRKMPALMRNADGRALCFTRRQVNTVVKAAMDSMFTDKPITADENDVYTNPPSIPVADISSQLKYRGKGNPFSVLPRTAISNCFPGLEFDFRNLWRRAFKEIVLIENNNYVLKADDPNLIHHRLLAIRDDSTSPATVYPMVVPTSGPVAPGGSSISLKTAANPNGVSFMEWSNSLAHILQRQGQTVTGIFTPTGSAKEVLYEPDNENRKYLEVSLTVNQFFKANSAELTSSIVEPGELTQGLCAPWQNDYRECACYYWAASRPDYVNVEADDKGLSKGDNWMTKKRSGEYVLDDRTDSRLISYDDLFKNWEGELNFIIKGNDALESPENETNNPIA